MTDSQMLDHVTLLEAQPFDKVLEGLSSSFATVQFGETFRTRKLGPPAQPKIPQTITATLPALARVETNGTNGSTSASGTPGMTWASLTAKPFVPIGVPTTRTSTPTSTSVSSPQPMAAKPVPGIDRNRHGQRIDKHDALIPNHEIQRIKKLKLCNIFYLQGPSYCTTANCSHSHTYPITAGEKKVLREVARMTPCYYKMDCEDSGCIYGHRCPQSKPNESGCWYGENCRFWGWGHGIDTRVVKTTRV